MKTHPTPTANTSSPHGIDLRVDTPAAGEVSVRIHGMRPAGQTSRVPLVIHFHAGNYLSGALGWGERLAGLLAEAGAVVVSPAYPLASDRPFPAALEVGHAVLAWAIGQRRRLAGADAPLYLAGAEAGANLALALAMQARDQRCTALAGQILVSPMLDPRVGTCSMRTRHSSEGRCEWAAGWQAYLDCGAAADHPYALPARALRLAGLPRALILSAADDPLRDEAQTFAARLDAAGTLAQCHLLPAPTGWPCALHECAGRPDWIAPVQQWLHDFLNPTPRQADGAKNAGTPRTASNPKGASS